MTQYEHKVEVYQYDGGDMGNGQRFVRFEGGGEGVDPSQGGARLSIAGS